ncbi:Guanine-nucleotide exchange factor [Komagataella phaffii CBS 7435]|uniref:Guanine nucleotide-exchange factor SEC12 n=3 Tax=Komagataella TaxID=460517 RepID=C4R8E1_KOMPG|nr:Guanine nucleotide exchange factor (GEF) [Komagataella phaffii GS115]AAF27636.1 Sec12 [Komagataella pastoris]CAH2450733.1 Guanine-nucleotide exchange factor [Komagataella phaffii CBS 7435]CAY71866.1 Guanine nucleotide exchange factor (GEF) [Komagataella phaffii GS115]CCA40532.1 Guanine-nucleotide exchange factor [Komagataella phaffii CBS 7435]
MMKPYTLDTGYPVYGAKFITKRTLLTAGGGGEGNNGIPNKLSGFRIDFTKVKAVQKFRELTLSANEDCPMSLDAANNVILLGVNENTSSIKQGKNNHLRKFGYINHHLKYLDKQQLSNSRDNRDYQKFTHLSSDASVACIATSKVPTTIYVVDPQTLEKKFDLETGVDVKDMHISPDGKIVCYVCANSLHGYSTVTAKLLFKDDSFKNHTLMKVKFLDQHHLLIVGSQKQGISLIHYSLAKNSIVNSRVISKKLKGVTSLDTRNGVIALSGNDNSLLLIKVSNLKPIKQFNKIHKFSITSCCFNKTGDLLATVSAANTVSVMEIPKGLATKKSLPRKIFNYFILTVFMAILAIVLQWSIENGHLQHAWQKLLNGDVIDSSRYFKVESIPDEELSASLLESSYSGLSSETKSVTDAISASVPIIETTVDTTTTSNSVRRTIPEGYSTAKEFQPDKIKLYKSSLDSDPSADSTGSFTVSITETQSSSIKPQKSKKTKKLKKKTSSTATPGSSTALVETLIVSTSPQSVDTSLSVTSPVASSTAQDSYLTSSAHSALTTKGAKKLKKKRKIKTKTVKTTKTTETETETETIVQDDLADITISSDIVSDISSEVSNSETVVQEGLPTEVIESLLNKDPTVDEPIAEESAIIDLPLGKPVTEKLTLDTQEAIESSVDEPAIGIDIEDAIVADEKEEPLTADDAVLDGEEREIEDPDEIPSEVLTDVADSPEEYQDDININNSQEATSTHDSNVSEETAAPVEETQESVGTDDQAEPEKFDEEEKTENEHQYEKDDHSELAEETQESHDDQVDEVEEVLEEVKDFLGETKDVLEEAKFVLEEAQEGAEVSDKTELTEQDETEKFIESSDALRSSVGTVEATEQTTATSVDPNTEIDTKTTSEAVIESNTPVENEESTVEDREINSSIDEIAEKSISQEEIVSKLEDSSSENNEGEREEEEIEESEDEKAGDIEEEEEEYEDDDDEYENVGTEEEKDEEEVQGDHEEQEDEEEVDDEEEEDDDEDEEDEDEDEDEEGENINHDEL